MHRTPPPFKAGPIDATPWRRRNTRWVVLWLAINTTLASYSQAASLPPPHTIVRPLDPLDNAFRISPLLPEDLRRVAVLPLAWDGSSNDLVHGSEVLSPILMAELVKTKKFEAVAVNSQDLMHHTGRQRWTGAEILPADWDDQKAYVHEVDVDYYTDANLAVEVKVLEVFRCEEAAGLPRHHGEVSVSAVATIYKKIKLHTHENVGWGRISLPEQVMHTEAAWFTLPATVTAGLSNDQVQAGLVGLGTVLSNVAPLFLMCDPRDIRAFTEVRSPFTGLPTAYLYDRYPGGTGLARRLYDLAPRVFTAARDLLRACPCPDGCPSCVGPANEVGPAKSLTARFLAAALAGEVGEAGEVGDGGPAPDGGAEAT